MKTDYTVMSAKVIGASAKKLGVKVAGDIVAKHHALAEHFKKEGGSGRALFECTSCGGLSTEDWTKCPYCDGVLDDEQEVAASVMLSAAKLEVTEEAGPNGEAVVTIEATGEEVFTVADLDASVKSITDRKASAQSSVWELGEAIRDNYERGLWKLRLKEGGKVAYTNYKRFVEAELSMSHTMAFNLMTVAKQFSREDVVAIGPTKLSIIAKVEDPEARGRLLEGARNGASVRETREAAAKENGEGGEAGEAVTFVARTGPVLSIPMKRESDGEDATRLEVGVWAEEEHDNGVVSAYSVEVEGESVVLRINRYRG